MLEEQKGMLENSNTMKDVFNTLKSTGEVLKSEQGAVKAEDIEKVREDMEDLKDSQNEVNEMFSGYAGQGNEEVDDELAQMEKEMAEEEVSLPSANKEDVPQVKVAEREAKKEEEALRDFLA